MPVEPHQENSMKTIRVYPTSEMIIQVRSHMIYSYIMFTICNLHVIIMFRLMDSLRHFRQQFQLHLLRITVNWIN